MKKDIPLVTFFIILAASLTICNIVNYSEDVKRVLSEAGVVYTPVKEMSRDNLEFLVDKVSPNVSIFPISEEFFINDAVLVLKSHEELNINADEYIYKSSNKNEYYYEVTSRFYNLGNNEISFDYSDRNQNVNNYKIILKKVKLFDPNIESNYIPGNKDSTIVANPDELTTIINDSFRLSAAYVPPDLVDIESLGIHNIYGGYLRHDAAINFKNMQDELLKSGINIEITSAYRSFQSQLYTYQYISHYEGKETAMRRAEIPGYSEHQLGLAVDVVNAETNFRLPKPGQVTKLYQWLINHSYEYGFICTYMNSIDKIDQELWHLRFFGVDIAKKIHESGLSAHEYLKTL